MDDAQFAKYLHDTAAASDHTPNSRDWWIEVAQAARKMLSISIEEAAALIEKELGGVEVSAQKLPVDADGFEVAPDTQETPEPTSAENIAPEGIGPRSAAHRTICSQRAAFPHPVMLDRRFRPSAYGYSGEDFQRDYPHANPRETLEKFFSHHIDKGDLHKNWLEKFWSYALMADRIAREQAADKTSTDSMGQPLDPAERARRVRVAREHERQQNEYIDQQIAAEREQP